MAGYESNLRALEEHLGEGESVVSSCYGLHGDQNGILVATRKRVIYFSKGWLGYDMESFDMAKITSVEVSKGLLGRAIRLSVPGNIMEMKQINAGNPDGLAAYVRDAAAAASRPAPPVTTSAPVVRPSTPQPASIPEQIKQLAVLMDAGVLTAEEFAAKKTELLARM